jgi:hypothetical protein
VLTTRRIRLATAVAAVLVCGMPGAAVAQQDLRMPDTRDAAIAATQTQDLRSPDARDAARADSIAAQLKRFEKSHRPQAQTSRPAPARSAPAPSDDTPWAVVAISLLAALGAVGAAVIYVRPSRRKTLASS